MSECPLCGEADEWDSTKRVCGNCGHFDERRAKRRTWDNGGI